MNKKEKAEEAKYITTQIIEFCEKNCSDLPRDKFLYDSHATMWSASKAATDLKVILSLLEINESNKKEKTLLVEQAVLQTLDWVSIGIGIDRSLPRELSLHDKFNYPYSYYLHLLEESDIATQEMRDTIHIAHALISLYLLSEHHFAKLSLYTYEESLEDHENAMNHYKGVIDSHGYLIEALNAFQRVAVSLALRDKSYVEKNILPLAQLGRGKQKIDDRNRKRRLEAEREWTPLVEEMHQKILEGKSITNAAKIIANRHGKNAGTLRNRYNKTKPS